MKVIWITGLSGSGKSTLAREVVNILREKGNTVILLDGDELREVFGAVNQMIRTILTTEGWHYLSSTQIYVN